MEMMHALAKDLNVKIETTRLKDFKSTLQMLNDGRLDIVVGGRAITPGRAIDLLFTDAYTFHTVGFLVQDSIRDKFATLENVRNMKNLQLYVPNTKYYITAIKKLLPNATYKTIKNPRKFFSLKHEKMTAFAFSAEVGSAWTLLYPAYSVVVPKGLKIKAPVAFALAKGQLDFAQYINTWLKLKKYNGFQQSVYDYWILGKNISKRKPRWSVANDVLSWDI